VKKAGVTIWNFLRRLWRIETIYLIFICVAAFGILSLVSLIPAQASKEEQELVSQSSSLRSILENPVNAPYKIATFALAEISPSVRMARAISFLFYMAACVSMFYTLKHWHTLQASILTTLAFATNAVILGTSRLGTPAITTLSFFIFSGLLLWQVHSRSNKTVPLIVLLCLAALLYVPGAVWFFIIIGVVYGNKYKHFFKNVKRPAVVIGTLLALLLMTPLILSFISDIDYLKEWLLLPKDLDWGNLPRSILRVPSAFIYRMPVEPLVNIARLPVFDITSGVMFLIGLNAYLRKMKLDRTRVMVGAALVAIVIGAFGQTLLAVILLLPFAYSVVAAGIEYLLDEWFSVFPRNPIARSFGVVMITTAVLFSTYYQLTRFFVVWPQAPETREVYDHSRIVEKL
jgi:hypothetical protein